MPTSTKCWYVAVLIVLLWQVNFHHWKISTCPWNAHQHFTEMCFLGYFASNWKASSENWKAFLSLTMCTDYKTLPQVRFSISDDTNTCTLKCSLLVNCFML